MKIISNNQEGYKTIILDFLNNNWDVLLQDKIKILEHYRKIPYELYTDILSSLSKKGNQENFALSIIWKAKSAIKFYDNEASEKKITEILINAYGEIAEKELQK